MSIFRCTPNPHWTMWMEARTDQDLEADMTAEKGLFKRVRFSVHVGWANGYTPEREIGFFELHPMPGCCGVVVSSGSFLNVAERGQFSNYFHFLKAYVAKELGYSKMLATCETGNFPEVIGAAKNGWRMHKAFTNKRTGHQLTVMEKDL